MGRSVEHREQVDIICGEITQIEMTSTQNVPRVFPFKVVNLHPGVTGRLLNLYFFSLRRVFLNFPILRGTNCTPKSCKRI